MSKLAIILVSVAFLSATGVVRADTNAGLQEKIAKLQQEKSFLHSRLNRAIAYSRENRTNLESELAAHKQKSAKERQTLLRRIARAKAYSRARNSNLESELAEQKASSTKERQTLLRRIARAKAYSRAQRGSNLEGELAAQKAASAKERQTLLRRIARAKAYSRARNSDHESELAMQKVSSAKERQALLRRIDRSKRYSRAKIQSLQASKAEWAASAGDVLDGKLGGIRGTTVSTNADDSVTVRVGNVGLFRTGGTVLSEEGAELLTTITRALSTTEGNITVVGHTDSVRVGSGSQFANNVELSFARAFSTLNFMRNRGIATERLSAAGYGAEQPIASNNTEQGRQQNRRVEIVVRK